MILFNFMLIKSLSMISFYLCSCISIPSQMCLPRLLMLSFRTSKCLDHAAVCGAGIGVFLLVRVCLYSQCSNCKVTSFP